MSTYNFPSGLPQPQQYLYQGTIGQPTTLRPAHSTTDLYLDGSTNLGQNRNRPHLVASSLGLSPIIDQEPWVRSPHTGSNHIGMQHQQQPPTLSHFNNSDNLAYLQRQSLGRQVQPMPGLGLMQPQQPTTMIQSNPQQLNLPTASIAVNQNVPQQQTLQSSMGLLPNSIPQQNQFTSFQPAVYPNQQQAFQNQNTVRMTNPTASNLAQPQYALRNRMDGICQSQGLTRDQDLGYISEPGADLRYRRSKEIFDQNQSARQAANLAQATAKLNLNSQATTAGGIQTNLTGISNPNYAPILAANQQGNQTLLQQGPQTLLQQQQQQQHNFMKQQQQQQIQAELYKQQDLLQQQLAAQQQQQFDRNRPVEQSLFEAAAAAAAASTGIARQRSQSADAQRFYQLNQEQTPTTLLSGTTPANHQISNNLPLQQVPLTTTSRDVANTAQHIAPNTNHVGYPTTLPVDLAHKLHAQHALAMRLVNQSTGRGDYDDQVFQTLQEMQQKAAILNTPNKMVSFNLPDGTTVDQSGKASHRKLSELFPDCEECRRLEDSRRLYRASLKLKRNNSDTTWNEFLKDANNQDRCTGMTIQDEENLRNLAKMVSATFSGDSDSNPDSLDARNLAATLKHHPLYKSTMGNEFRYNAAGQKIPTVPSLLSNRESSILERLERQQLLIEREKRELLAARRGRDYESISGDPYYLDVFDYPSNHITGSQMAQSDYLTHYPDNSSKLHDYQDLYTPSTLQYDRGRSKERTSAAKRQLNSTSKDRRMLSRGERLSPDSRRRERSKSRPRDESPNYRRRGTSPDERQEGRARGRDRTKERGSSNSRYMRDQSPTQGHGSNYMGQYDADQYGLNGKRYYQKGMGGSSRNIVPSSTRNDRQLGSTVGPGPDDIVYGSLPRRTQPASKDRQYMDSDEYNSSGGRRRNNTNSLGNGTAARELSGRRHTSHEQLNYVDRNKERFLRDGESSSSSIDRLSPDRYRRRQANHMTKSHDYMQPSHDGGIAPRGVGSTGAPQHHSRNADQPVHLYQDGNDRRKLPDTPHNNSNESGYSSAHTNSQPIPRVNEQVEMHQEPPPRRGRRYNRNEEEAMARAGMDERQMTANNGPPNGR